MNEKDNKKKLSKKLASSAVLAGVLAFAGQAVANEYGGQAPKAADKHANQEKCYGVALKGKNDCGTAKHSCAGQSTADKDPGEWKFVEKGTCAKMGGTTK